VVIEADRLGEQCISLLHIDTADRDKQRPVGVKPTMGIAVPQPASFVLRGLSSQPQNTSRIRTVRPSCLVDFTLAAEPIAASSFRRTLATREKA
jgi:hypothetical protein